MLNNMRSLIAEIDKNKMDNALYESEEQFENPLQGLDEMEAPLRDQFRDKAMRGEFDNTFDATVYQDAVSKFVTDAVRDTMVIVRGSIPFMSSDSANGDYCDDLGTFAKNILIISGDGVPHILDEQGKGRTVAQAISESDIVDEMGIDPLELEDPDVDGAVSAITTQGVTLFKKLFADELSKNLVS